MLSYQHGYHAGNFADVVKHLTLSYLIDYLTRKEKPLFYLETHAGKGLYNLKDSQALKTKEYQQGIELLWKQKTKLHPGFQAYLKVLQALNEESLALYPGSPLIALNLLRPEDRLYCCELHPKEFSHLEQLANMAPSKRVFFSHSDGLASLNALLPPKERRGLIFIDPSYEVKDDYKKIPRQLKEAYQRFSTGTYCLWYPILADKMHRPFLNQLNGITNEKLCIEFYQDKNLKVGMIGCGLWLLNPPFKLQEELQPALKQLTSLLNPPFSSIQIGEPSLSI